MYENGETFEVTRIERNKARILFSARLIDKAFNAKGRQDREKAMSLVKIGTRQEFRVNSVRCVNTEFIVSKYLTYQVESAGQPWLFLLG